MKVIDTYLDTLFARYPNTPALAQARQDLRAMMLEQVDALMEAGKTETQAIGAVIAEFGSLEEVADQLGVRDELGAYATKPATATSQTLPPLPLEIAQEYADARRQASPARATSIALYLLAPAFLMFMLALDTSLATFIGFASLLVLVATAIGVGMVGEKEVNRLRTLHSGQYSTSEQVTQWAKKLESDNDSRITPFKIAGIALFLISPLWVLAPTFLAASQQTMLLGVGLLLLTAAAGVWLLTYKGWAEITRYQLTHEIFHTDEDYEYEPENSSSPLVRVLSAALWPVTLIIFLIWGLAFDGWDKSWILFPLAGLAYWLLSSVAASLEKK